MRQRVAQATKRFFRNGSPRQALERTVKAALRLNPSLGTLFQDQPSTYGAVMPVSVTDAQLVALLDGLPTETTQQERRYLYRFFSTLWEGQGDVVEIGPFLGGTTRAIALGMMDNPRRSQSSKLYTYDRFAAYHTTASLLSLLDPHFRAGQLPPALREQVAREGTFRGVFDRLHEGHRYSHLIVAEDRVVPDSAELLQSTTNPYRVDAARSLGAVFIEGCKSWFGTRYFVLETARHTKPGSYFIFQDYGFYTCFWIPVFVALLGDVLELVSYVDSTYTFQQRAPFDEAAVMRAFPDTPQELGEPALSVVFEQLLEAAKDRGDERGVLSLSLQRAAAMAYIGRLDDARSRIAALAAQPQAEEYRTWIAQAAKTPTYTPNGEIYR